MKALLLGVVFLIGSIEASLADNGGKVEDQEGPIRIIREVR